MFRNLRDQEALIPSPWLIIKSMLSNKTKMNPRKKIEEHINSKTHN